MLKSKLESGETDDINIYRSSKYLDEYKMRKGNWKWNFFSDFNSIMKWRKKYKIFIILIITKTTKWKKKERGERTKQRSRKNKRMKKKIWKINWF